MKISLIVLVMLPLAACVRFGAEPPPSLLTLDSAVAPQAGQAQSSAAARSIVIAVPTVPQSLATPRVPVQVTPTSIAYVEDAQWTEPPARLFARVLTDAVSARSGYVVLSTVQSVGDPSSQMAGDLRRFGLDASAREAVVVFDAALTRAGGAAVEKRRFEARVPVATIDAASAATGLNQAANQVAVEVADWVRGGA